MDQKTKIVWLSESMDCQCLIWIWKAFLNIQHRIRKETLSKLQIKGNFLILIKVMYQKSITNIIINRINLDAFPLRLDSRPGVHHHCYCFTGSWKLRPMIQGKKGQKSVNLRRKEKKSLLLKINHLIIYPGKTSRIVRQNKT